MALYGTIPNGILGQAPYCIHTITVKNNSPPTISLEASTFTLALILIKNDVNEIRRRAKAPELPSVTLDDILDERARELYLSLIHI